MTSECSALEKCRNSFFSVLALHEKGFPSYILTAWSNAEWSIFLGPEDVAKNLLLNRPKVIVDAVRWTAFPCREGWLNDPYSPDQISEWVLSQEGNTPIEKQAPNIEYQDWLKEFIAKLEDVPDALPTVSFSNGAMTAWMHRRNPDLTTKKIPIDRYAFDPPLPRHFEDERRLLIVPDPEGENGGWPFRKNGGFTVPSVGIEDDFKF
jgi:hypothetical protein